MSISLNTLSPHYSLAAQSDAHPSRLEPPPSPAKQASPELREAFTQFVGETFYSQLLSAMRSTVQKPAYFHGGRGEEVFQGQLDQILAQDMTKATADRFAGPMFDLFMLGRPK